MTCIFETKNKEGDLAPSRLSECSFQMHYLYTDTWLMLRIADYEKTVTLSLYSKNVCD